MSEAMAQRPTAKRIGVLIEELGDETVLFDPARDRFVRLNPLAYFVWNRCDGTATVAEITAAVEAELDLDDAAEVVWLAIELLVEEDLLDGDVAVPSTVDEDDVASGPMSRRTMLRLAAAGVALPIVASIVAPSPASAQSVPGGGGGGGGGGAVDCVVSDWSAWAPCDKPCGSGSQTRTRTVITPASGGGAPCPTLEQTQPCNTQPCPVDCVVSSWSAWTPCDKPCGGGTQTRTRTIVTAPAFGGAPCPTLQETQNCNTQPCPVDCVVSAWSAWGPCSAPCGGGTQTRTRTITTFPAFGGAPCPSLTDTQVCNDLPCP